MRTTIRLDDHLLHEAKRWAAETNRTLAAVIEEALREVLARRRRSEPRRHIALPTFGGSGPRAGLNLDSTAELLEAMDADAWSHPVA